MSKRPDINDINNAQGFPALGPIPGISPVAAFNREQVESLLETKGINALHYKHAPIPDRSEAGGPVTPNTQESKWGVRFFEVRKLKIVPQSFNLEHRLSIQGIWGVHTVLLNVAGYYSDSKEKDMVFCRPNDLIVLDTDCNGDGVTIEMDQIFEYNQNGPMQLNFRVEKVRYLADARKSYVSDQDFTINDGKIVWLQGGTRPAMGSVLTIVYYAKPIYIVKNVPHAIRILPSNIAGHGGLPRKAEYAPQLVIASQSWIRQDSQNLLDFHDLPGYPGYGNTPNVPGGTF